MTRAALFQKGQQPPELSDAHPFDLINNLRQLSGATGKLDEVYEQLVSPDTVGKIERYFAEGYA